MARLPWGTGTFVLVALLVSVRLPCAAIAEPMGNRAYPTYYHEDPTGEDPTRPRPELAFKFEFQNLPGRSPDSASTFTLEGIALVPVNEKWAGRLRFEMPLVLTNAPADDESHGSWRFGSGDLLTEAAGIFYPNERWAVAAGGQVIFPTASRDVTGANAWILGVGGLVRAMLSELSADSFVAPQLVYAFDAGGSRDRGPVSQLRIQPTFHWALPRNLFMELFPSGDIVVNLDAPDERGRWFLPLNALAGILVTPKLVTTLEVGIPLVKDYPVYDFKLVATVGYFFD